MIFQRSSKGVSRKFSSCFKKVWRKFQGWFKSIPGVFSENFKGVDVSIKIRKKLEKFPIRSIGSNSDIFGFENILMAEESIEQTV